MGTLKKIEKKYMVIENFLPNLEKFIQDIHKINLLEQDKYNEKYNAKDTWSGLRSGDLFIENKFLFFLILQNLNKVCFLKKYGLKMCLHLRRQEDVMKDWIHIDPDDFAFLIYLNNTNLSSGTYLYDDEGNVISDIKYVHNRFVIYSGSYKHMGYGHFGKSSDEGRLTINGFLNVVE